MPTQSALRRAFLPASALTLAAAAVLGPATPAQAGGTPPGIAEIQNLRLQFTAAPKQANRLTVTMESTGDGFFRYTLDDTRPISAGEGCEHPAAEDLTRVVCRPEALETQDPYVIARFRLGEGNDTVRFHNRTGQVYYSNEFWLGAGNDKADTRPRPGGIDGSGIWGQNGRDEITAGHIGDLGGVSGGNNNDTIRVSGGYNSAQGGNGDDKLYSDEKGAVLRGDDGDDLVDGGAGADSLYGGGGNDVVYGRAGADQLYGNSGNDQLYGGPGNDTISGGPGRDRITHD